MRVQEAAYRLLLQEGRPLSSRELARLALDGGLVTSASADPVLSISSTIEKNIRQGTYNRPVLVFVRTADGRRIGLPNWRAADLATPEPRKFAVHIPVEIAEQVRLAAQAGLAPSFEATVARLLQLGLAAAAHEIRESVERQLDALERKPSRRFP